MTSKETELGWQTKYCWFPFSPHLPSPDEKRTAPSKFRRFVRQILVTPVFWDINHERRIEMSTTHSASSPVITPPHCTSSRTLSLKVSSKAGSIFTYDDDTSVCFSGNSSTTAQKFSSSSIFSVPRVQHPIFWLRHRQTLWHVPVLLSRQHTHVYRAPFQVYSQYSFPVHRSSAYGLDLLGSAAAELCYQSQEDHWENRTRDPMRVLEAMRQWQRTRSTQRVALAWRKLKDWDEGGSLCHKIYYIESM